MTIQQLLSEAHTHQLDISISALTTGCQRGCIELRLSDRRNTVSHIISVDDIDSESIDAVAEVFHWMVQKIEQKGHPADPGEYMVHRSMPIAPNNLDLQKNYGLDPDNAMLISTRGLSKEEGQKLMDDYIIKTKNLKNKGVLKNG